MRTHAGACRRAPVRADVRRCVRTPAGACGRAPANAAAPRRMQTRGSTRGPAPARPGSLPPGAGSQHRTQGRGAGHSVVLLRADARRPRGPLLHHRKISGDDGDGRPRMGATIGLNHDPRPRWEARVPGRAHAARRPGASSKVDTSRAAAVVGGRRSARGGRAWRAERFRDSGAARPRSRTRPDESAGGAMSPDAKATERARRRQCSPTPHKAARFRRRGCAEPRARR